ncbi:MAG: hypothetical protein ISR47_06425 [Rhodospirillales bacterium]|nr:hypothetical protein [Rhodospirillales bacterium]
MKEKPLPRVSIPVGFVLISGLGVMLISMLLGGGYSATEEPPFMPFLRFFFDDGELLATVLAYSIGPFIFVGTLVSPLTIVVVLPIWLARYAWRKEWWHAGLMVVLIGMMVWAFAISDEIGFPTV